jgi:sec-independent protein translocase protein TatC
MESSEIYCLLGQVVARLRRQLLVLAGLLVVTTIVGYFLADDVMRYMFKMVRQVIFISLTEAFVTKVKVAFCLGLVFSMPAVLYLAIGAIRVRAKAITARSHRCLTGLSYLLFLTGAAFCYFVVLPVGLDFLLNFATLEMQPLLSAGRFMSFVLTCLMVFGMMFELPLFIMLGASLGLLTVEALRARRRYAILLIFIVAGFLTPSPDVVSQVLLAIPMLALYELGILLARFYHKPEPAPEMPADQQQLFM